MAGKSILAPWLAPVYFCCLQTANAALPQDDSDAFSAESVLRGEQRYQEQQRLLKSRGAPSVTAALALSQVVSRKTHGAAGVFDLVLDASQPITGNVTIEPRAAGAGHAIVFKFGAPVTTAGTASAKDMSGASIGSVSASAAGSEVVVTLTNVPDNRRVSVALTGVNGSTDASVALGFLLGDTDNSRAVNVIDLTAIKSQAGRAVTAANFLRDIDASGSINVLDVIAAKIRSGAASGPGAPPTVTLSAPTSAQSGVVRALNATAAATGASVFKVEFFEGGTKIGESQTTPYRVDWTPVAEGAVTLTARVTDSNGAATVSAPVTVTVGAHPAAAAARLLAQTTFGATRAEIDRVAAMTPSAYLDEQFAKPQTSHLTTVRNDPLYPTKPYAVTMPSIWKQYFEAQDQLRQRVVFALSQIVVLSMQNNTVADQACGMGAYLDILGRNAFGNFRTLLKEVTLTPAMGEYLDMKQSAKADPVLNSIANENYARELMQLFSIGTVMLNLDGSVQFSGGKPIDTYSETTTREFARALTGWTFAKQDQTKPWRWTSPDVPYPKDAATAAKACDGWSTPMEPWRTAYRASDGKRDIAGSPHDMGAKTLLSYPGAASHKQNVPAGQTAEQDLDDVIENLFNHPNVGPFIGEQLIQRLVTSNPSAAYVSRVATVFNDNGAGVRGDLKAVVRAILLDPEARLPMSQQPPGYGKLREPALRFVHLHRAFGAVMQGGSYASIYDLTSSDSLAQNPLRSPSVFNFYHPDYSPAGPLGQAGLVGPEFEISNSATLAGFMNFSKFGIIGGFGEGDADPATWIKPDYSAYTALASTPAAMVDALNVTLMAGSMSAQFRAQLIDVATRLTESNATTQANERFRTVLWLILNSPEYSIQK